MKPSFGIPVVVALGLATAGAAADERFRPYAAVGVEELFDSNVENSHGADSVTRVSPRVGFLTDDERLVLGLEYRAALHLYAEEKAPNSLNHRAAGAAKLRLSRRVDLAFSGVYLAADDPVLLDRPGVAIPQGGFTDLTLNLGVTGRVTRDLTLDATYGYRRSRFDLAGGPGGLAYDGDEHRVDTGARLTTSRRLTLVAGLRWEHFVSNAAIDDAYGGGGGLEYLLGRSTRLRLLGGPLEFAGQGLTWYATASLRHEFTRGRIGLDAIRDLYGGTGASEAVWAESVMLNGYYKLSRRAIFKAHAGAYLSGPAPDLDSDVSGLLGHAEVGWLMFDNQVLVELYGEHRAQGATGGLAFGDVQRTVVGLRLIYAIGADVLAIGEVP